MAFQLASGTFLAGCMIALQALLGIITTRWMIIEIVWIILAIPAIVWWNRRFMGSD